jgi:HPt (histidine-containing phosphotransfer) domain-containing protein
MAARRHAKTASQPQPDVTVFDRAHLARYTMDSPELEREITGLFASQLSQTVDQIRTAAAAGDWRLATHSLKGSAAAVGAWRIHGLAQSLEAAGPGRSAGQAGLLAELDEAVVEFCAAMAQFYS